MAIAFAFCWLAGIPLAALGCGPFFPNWMLAEGDSAVLASPQTKFSQALAKLLPRTATNLPAAVRYGPHSTLKAEVADLRHALDNAGTAAAERDAIVAQHLVERARIGVFALLDNEATLESLAGPPLGGTAFVLRPDPTNNTRIKGILPRVTPGLPPEFADYFEGSVAWHRGDFAAARLAWLRLLDRPPAERRHKSTWAAFMLGKSWEEENRGRAIRYFQKVRELVREGFTDSLGLGAQSLGWEARLHWREGHYTKAIALYLDQAAAGDASATLSLRLLASAALDEGPSTLRPLARDARARTVITAYIASGGYRKPPMDSDSALKEAVLRAWEKASAKFARLPAPKASWHTMTAPVTFWLEAVERAGAQDLELAELLALAAYQGGEFETARRWLRRAPSGPLTQWLQAKLLLRDGQVDQAAALLATVRRQFPLKAEATNSVNSTRLPHDLIMFASVEMEWSRVASAAEQTTAELAVFRLARRQFVEALDLFLHSSPEYWMDAAYVAERVLTLDELKRYVDQQWPPEPLAPEKAKEDVTALIEPTDGGPSPGFSWRSMIRYLLARRLARAWRLAEARPYYPPEWQPRFDELLETWQKAERADLPEMVRARALLDAAFQTRKFGLELIGTEVEPDWGIHAGNFLDGVTVQGRVSLRKANALAATAEEAERGARHKTTPEQRWHYRQTATAIAWEAAWMMGHARDADQAPEERAWTLFGTAQALRRSSISPDGLRLSPDGEPAKPAASLTNDLTARVSLHVSNFFAAPAADPAPLQATTNRPTPEMLWQRGYVTAALAWEAARLLPNNSDETARVLCMGGRWLDQDPAMADLFYKALVRRCRKTEIGAQADRIRWFPRLDSSGLLLPREQQPLSPSERKERKKAMSEASATQPQAPAQ